MAQRTTGKVARRELYDRFDPEREPLQQARALFLDMYAREKPDVLSELESFVAEAAKLRLHPTHSENFFPPDCWLLSESEPDFERLRNDLGEWASRFRFTIGAPDNLVPAPWVMDTALSTLGRWAQSSTRRPLTPAHNFDRLSPWVHPDLLHHVYDEDSLVFEFRVDGRHLKETRRQFEKRVAEEGRAIAKKRLDEDDRRRQDELDRRACWANSPEISPKTVERLARWQANQELMLKEIDPRAISNTGIGNASKDLTKAAEYIGITRRPAATAAGSRIGVSE